MAASEQQCGSAPIGTLVSGPASKASVSSGLWVRVVWFALLLAAEWAPLTNLVHKYWGAGSLLEIATASGSFFLALAYIRSRESFDRLSNELRSFPIRWSLLGLHLVALAAFLGLSVLHSSGFVVVALWYGTGVLAIGLAGCALVPPRLAYGFVRETGYAWLYALAAGLVAWRVLITTRLWNGAVWNPAIDLSWKPATDLTFSLVQALLRPFLAQLIANRSTMTIGTPKFTVTILPWCAGFEGTALMLIFSTAWLLYFRQEFRFPRALLLIPAGMLVIWVSNAVRIASLVLIGVAGAPAVAAGGFHSQAGWIAFNCVALGFVILTRRMPWFSTMPREEKKERTGQNLTAAYLVPFLAILTAAMISRAASGGFEWLYLLRFIAAAGALWFFRAQYRNLDWRFGGFSLLAGCVVFALWLGLDKLAGPHPSSAIAAGLASLNAPQRAAWLGFRIAAAVITVPIAEELAFRGFLIRRISSADFDSLDPRHYTYFAVFVSSLAFGVLHGERWLAGTLAGVIYAIAFLRRGRIGDAVIAHAVTNALLAACVLFAGRWDLW